MNNEIKNNNEKNKEIELNNNKKLKSKIGQSGLNEKEYEYSLHCNSAIACC